METSKSCYLLSMPLLTYRFILFLGIHLICAVAKMPMVELILAAVSALFGIRSRLSELCRVM